MENRQWLAEIAAQIADGHLIDWAAVEARADSDRDREVIKRLQSIERLTQAQTALTASHPDDDPVISSWGALTVIQRVGRGTFGDVYRAWDPRLDRQVALKILRRRELTTSGTDSAIIDEARMMALLRHPNVVTVYGAERIDGRVGIWMEFVEGRTLEQEVRETGPFHADDLLAVATDLCSALSAVHQAGLLHRDIKAQNVMRAADGRILLTDFGAGRDGALSAKRDEVELAGTPLYIAPEVLNGEPASVRSDLYSLGVLLFHLSTGSFPITGRTVGEIRTAHQNRNVAVGRLPTPLPRLAASAIHHLLAPDAGQRPADAEQVRDALISAGQDRRRTTKRLFVGGWAALSVAVLLLLWGQRSSSDKSAEIGFRRINQSWSPRTWIGGPSPDGRWVICLEQLPRSDPFSLTRTRQLSQLSRCEIGTGRATPIAVVDSAGPFPFMTGVPQLSADGRSIAYITSDLESVRQIDVNGTNDHEVARIGSIGPELAAFEQVSVSGNSRVLALAALSPNRTTKLFILEQAKSPRLLKEVSWGLAGFHLSADGRWLAYAADSDRLSVRVIDTESREEHLVLPAGSSNDFAPLWTFDGALVFLSDRNGGPSFWKTRITAGRGLGEPELLQEYGRQGTVPLGVSRDGMLFFRVHSAQWEVRTTHFDLTRPERVTPTEISLASATLSNASAADWSPDGRWLVLASQNARRSVFSQTLTRPIFTLRDVSTGNEEKVTAPFRNSQLVSRIRWSPTGDFFAFCCEIDSGRRWKLIGRRGREVDQTRAIGPAAQAFRPSDVAISPDGWNLYYPANSSQIRKAALNLPIDTTIYSSDPLQAVGDTIALSADGRRLAFLTRVETATEVRILDVLSRQANTLVSLPLTQLQNVQIAGWARNDDWLVLSTTSTANISTVRAIDVASRSLRDLLIFPTRIMHPRINATGTDFAFSTYSEKPIEVWTLAVPASAGVSTGKAK